MAHPAIVQKLPAAKGMSFLFTKLICRSSCASYRVERKIELLDAEFRRLVKKIDQEYNRVA
jgi:hypothetical protein